MTCRISGPGVAAYRNHSLFPLLKFLSKTEREERDSQERREKTGKGYFHLLLPPYSNMHQEEVVDVRMGKRN